MQHLRAGESYQVCLTNMLTRQWGGDPWALYTKLRELNPAPYAAWLHFARDQPTICCSSPERFLKATPGGVLEARPIKGMVVVARWRGYASRDPMAERLKAVVKPSGFVSLCRLQCSPFWH